MKEFVYCQASKSEVFSKTNLSYFRKIKNDISVYFSIVDFCFNSYVFKMTLDFCYLLKCINCYIYLAIVIFTCVNCYLLSCINNTMYAFREKRWCYINWYTFLLLSDFFKHYIILFFTSFLSWKRAGGGRERFFKM